MQFDTYDGFCNALHALSGKLVVHRRSFAPHGSTKEDCPSLAQAQTLGSFHEHRVLNMNNAAESNGIDEVEYGKYGGLATVARVRCDLTAYFSRKRGTLRRRQRGEAVTEKRRRIFQAEERRRKRETLAAAEAEAAGNSVSELEGDMATLAGQPVANADGIPIELCDRRLLLKKLLLTLHARRRQPVTCIPRVANQRRLRLLSMLRAAFSA